MRFTAEYSSFLAFIFCSETRVQLYSCMVQETVKAHSQEEKDMSKAASEGQVLEIVARVATQIRWKDLDHNRLQKNVISLTAEEFGKRFTAFLNNDCRVIIGDSKSLLTKLFNPAEFIGKNWATWKGPIDGDGLSGEEDVDPRSLALAEVELARFLFETCLLAGEKSVTGEEKLRRLKEKPEFIRFGGNVFLGLWHDYQTYKENSILEWFYRNFGVTFMDFIGQILRHPHGNRNVLYLRRSAYGEWYWRYYWLDDQWGAGDPSVGCASQPLAIES